MHKQRAVAVLTSVVCGCLLLAGCTKDTLDRKIAQPQIEKKLHGMGKSLTVRVGRVGSHCSSIEAGGNTFEVDDNPNQSPDTLAAIKAGYVTAVPDGKDFWKVSLTPAGKAFADAEHVSAQQHEAKNGCETDIYFLPVASPQLFMIDGVSVGDQEPEVTYLWKWNVTDLGATLRENGSAYKQMTSEERRKLEEFLNLAEYGPHLSIPVPEEHNPPLVTKASVKFKRFDNGWRIQ